MNDIFTRKYYITVYLAWNISFVIHRALCIFVWLNVAYVLSFLHRRLMKQTFLTDHRHPCFRVVACLSLVECRLTLAAEVVAAASKNYLVVLEIYH